MRSEAGQDWGQTSGATCPQGFRGLNTVANRKSDKANHRRPLASRTACAKPRETWHQATSHSSDAHAHNFPPLRELGARGVGSRQTG